MVRCEICSKEFTDEQQKGGVLTRHLNEQHNMSLEDYIVLTKYNNNPPKCCCGYCDERPVFKRGEFLNYAKGHNTFKWKVNKYIENYGHPICKREGCSNKVKFYRGEPNLYCSHECKGLDSGGFIKDEVQNKIRDSVKEKYGVYNVIYSDEVKTKQKNSLEKVWNERGKDIIRKTKKTKRDRYGDANYINIDKHKNTIKQKYGVDNVSQFSFIRNLNSNRMINRNPMKNPESAKKVAYKLSLKDPSELVKTYRYEDTNLYYQSSYEYNFLRFCEDNDLLHKVDNGIRFEFLDEDKDIGYFYMSDFLYDNQYIIEVKSNWIKEVQGGDKMIEAKRKCVENCGYVFILIMDNDLDGFKRII